MPSEQRSHTSKRFDSTSTSRINFQAPTTHKFNPNDASSTPKQRDGLKTPLEAAMGVKSSYVATLHESLVTFLDDLAEKSIRLFSDFYYNNIKYQANSTDQAYIPKSIKQIGLVTLQATEEVMESKDFKTLQLKLSADLDATRRRLTHDYFLPVEDLHRQSLKRRFQLSICRLLTSAALGFVAELDIKNNNEHEAVMNLLATSPTYLLVDPIANDAREFLLLYKEAHKLNFVPLPTIEHNALKSLFDEINGHELTKKRITEAMQYEKTNFNMRPTGLSTNAETPSTITTTDEICDISLPTLPTLLQFDPALNPIPDFNTPRPARPDTMANPYITTDKVHPTKGATLPNPYITANNFDPAISANTTVTHSTLATTQRIQLTTLPINVDEDNEPLTFNYSQFPHEPEAIEATQAAELLAKLKNFVKLAIHVPLHTFATTHSTQITARRITQATTPSIYRTAAQRIAAAIQKEPSVSHPTLTGLIAECASKQNHDLHLKVQSIQDQITEQRTSTINTHHRTPKNTRGSSNLIWNRVHPSRNTSNQAAADTQRFTQQQPPNPTKRPRKHPQPPNKPNTHFTQRFIPRSNTYPPTSAEPTQPGQPKRNDTDGSLEPARKRGWKPSENNTDMR